MERPLMILATHTWDATEKFIHLISDQWGFEPEEDYLVRPDPELQEGPAGPYRVEVVSFRLKYAIEDELNDNTRRGN